MEPDIVARVAADFAPADRGEALGLLGLLAADVGGQPRVLHSVVFLARGELGRLAHNADRARADWRDVISWAEYDEQDRQVRDFNQPFHAPSPGGYVIRPPQELLLSSRPRAGA